MSLPPALFPLPPAAPCLSLHGRRGAKKAGGAARRGAATRRGSPRGSKTALSSPRSPPSSAPAAALPQQGTDNWITSFETDRVSTLRGPAGAGPLVKGAYLAALDQLLGSWFFFSSSFLRFSLGANTLSGADSLTRWHFDICLQYKRVHFVVWRDGWMVMAGGRMQKYV